MNDKAAAFRALHERPRIFVVANCWDVGSAKIFSALGFEALATTSSGHAYARGRLDKIGETSRDEALRAAAAIAAAVAPPLSADLENGFGDAPQTVADTVRAALAAGLAGCSIEDASGNDDAAIYDKTLAVERIAAAAEAKGNSSFVLTARAENYLHGRPDFDDTLERLAAYAAAGADVVFAPALPDLAAIRRVCAAINKPVNVIMGIGVSGLAGVTLAQLEECGVRRVSVGSAFARAAWGAAIRAAEEVRRDGAFSSLESAATFKRIEKLFDAGGLRAAP